MHEKVSSIVSATTSNYKYFKKQALAASLFSRHHHTTAKRTSFESARPSFEIHAPAWFPNPGEASFQIHPRDFPNQAPRSFEIQASFQIAFLSG